MNNNVLTSRQCFVFLLIFSAVIYLSAIGFKELWKTDETRVAGISANMARTGEYAMPYLNGEEFLEYPPLYYWTTAISYKIIGKTLFASRLSSALCAIFSVLLIFVLVRKMGHEPITAFMAGIIAATTGQFWSIGNRCLVDMMLCFFIVASMYSFYTIHTSFLNKEKFSKIFIWCLILIASFGFGIMTKSLLGLAVPSCALFFWLLIESILNKSIYLKSWISLILCSILSFIPVGLWMLQLYEKFGYDAVHTVAVINTFGRFFGSYKQHENPAWYYLGKLPEQFLPWTVVLGIVAAFMIYKKIKFPLNRDNRFLFCWIIFPFLLFSLSTGKRPVYLLPLYPATAVIMALLIENLITKVEFLSKFNWKKITLAVSALLLVGFVTAGLIVAFANNKKYTCITIFNYYKKSDLKQKNLYLYSETEYMRGAINYYLNKNVPVLNSNKELAEVMAKKDVCVLAPYSEDLKQYDIVKTLKVKGDEWCFLSN